MHKEKCFQKVKFNYKATKYEVLAVHFDVLFLRWHKIYYCVTKNSHKQFMIMYFNILAFVISLSNFNIFLFEQ